MLDELRTDSVLLARLTEAAKRQLTSSELRKQRVSYVFGNMRDESTMSRAQVEAVLDRAEGRSA